MNLTSLVKSIALTSLIGFSLPAVSDADIEIPKIDWQELQKTKPWKATENWTPVKFIEFNKEIPSDAVVLFDGRSTDAWRKVPFDIPANFEQSLAVASIDWKSLPVEKTQWSITDGVLQTKGDWVAIASRKSFGSVQLHLEWLNEFEPDKQGQDRGNSGVFLMGLYEVQILDSYKNPTYTNGQAGALYKQHTPLVNASKPPGNWQTYDIFFTSPEFSSSGELLKPAYLTVLHNGVLIQNHVEVKGPTLYIGETRYMPHASELPLILQDHGNTVRFRNIWIREL